MKKVMLLVLMLLSGCVSGDTHTRVRLEELQFPLGTKVRSTLPFYSKCEGVIEGYSPIRDLRHPVSYQVSFWCPNVGRLGEGVYLFSTSLRMVGEK